MEQDQQTPEETPEHGAPSLHRSSKRRLVAGVAGGIGERFDVDANIVRVVFVVLTCLWGLGAAIYLAMWALIPLAHDDGLTAGERDEQLAPSTSRWPYYALLAGVLVVGLIFVTTVGGVPQFGRGLAWLWLAFLIVLAVISFRSPARRLTFRRLVALAFLIFVSVIILVSGAAVGYLASTGVPFEGGNGARNWQPTSLRDTQSAYRTEFGTSTVDLSNVVFPVTGYDVIATVTAGELVIKVPSDAIVDLRTHVGVGRVSFGFDHGSSGPGYFRAVPRTLTTAASRARAPHLTVDAAVGAGEIIVVRSPAN